MKLQSSYTIEHILTKTNFFVSKKKGSIFKMTSPMGKVTYFDERVLDLRKKEKSFTVSILKSDWKYKLPHDLYVALVVVIQGEIPYIYLIPSKVFEKPDNIVFFNIQFSGRLEHFSNWQIKVLSKAIEKLSEFAFDRVVGELK